MIRFLIIALLVAILGSLFSGLFFLNRDQAGSGRMARALTVRITLSVLLFIVLLAAWCRGGLQPHDITPSRP